MTHPAMRESDLLRTVRDYLELHGIFHIRVNVGAKVEHNGMGQKRFIRFGRRGCADILCCVGGRFVALELKTERGQQSEYQKEFEAEVRAAGGCYLLIRSLDDLMELLPVRQKRLELSR